MCRTRGDTRKISLVALTIAVALTTFHTPLASEAQGRSTAEKTYRVGWLSQGSAATDLQRESFVRRLDELGYAQGRNLVIESLWAETTDQFSDLAAQLVRLRLDVIVTIGMPATQAVARASQNVAIVMVAGGAAVDAGLIRSLAKPGGNVTGVALQVNPDLSAKRLEYLKVAVPDASRVVYLQDSRSPAAAANLAAVQAAAPRLGVTLLLLDLAAPDDFERLFVAIIRTRPDAILLQGSPFQSLHAARIAEFANRTRIPWVSSFRQFADAGALLSYGPRLTDLVVRAASYVDRLLKGAKPADLPVEQPTTFELVVNIKSAKALGLTIPPSLLLQADRLIE